MRARDVAAGEDHHHEHRTDREAGEVARVAADRGHRHGEDEKERPDELRHVLAHRTAPHESACRVVVAGF